MFYIILNTIIITLQVTGASCHIFCTAVNIPQGRFTFESEYRHIPSNLRYRNLLNILTTVARERKIQFIARGLTKSRVTWGELSQWILLNIN